MNVPETAPSVAPARPGQLLHVGLPGVEVPDALAGRLAEGRIGGVVLFSRNAPDVGRLRALCRELHALAPPDAPLLVSVDQEGGRVQRLRAPFTEWPPMRRLGDRDDPEATGAVAAALGRELREAGIDLDFAPVVDVATEPSNPVIGDRSFGETADRVMRHAARFVAGLQGAGVLACAKHFPGHGDTTVDSHLALPVVPHDRTRLSQIELPPFRAAIEAGVACVMTSHVLFPALDPVLPATLSRRVLGILREELGFDGVVVSDDLDMRAVADRWPMAERVRRGLEAGVDVFLACSDAAGQEEALQALESAPAAQLEPALRRVAALKARLPPPAPGATGPPYPDHQRLAGRV